jgi:hypothetical protein
LIGFSTFPALNAPGYYRAAPLGRFRDISFQRSNAESVLAHTLKPRLIVRGLRGPFDKLRASSEEPLFHGHG